MNFSTSKFTRDEYSGHKQFYMDDVQEDNNNNNITSMIEGQAN